MEENDADLVDGIYNYDWETTIRILQAMTTRRTNGDDLPSVQEELSEEEFDILWNEAPLEVLVALLNVWPDVYTEISSGSFLSGWNLPQMKMKNEEWDVLDAIIKQFPQVLTATNMKEAIGYEAPLDFLRKHWKNDVPMLSFSINNKDWGAVMDILENQQEHVQQEEISRDDFRILHKDAPVEVLCALIKTWPEIYKEQCPDGDNLLRTKLKSKQWNILDVLFQNFPHLLHVTDVKEVTRNGAPVEFLKKYWNEIGMLLFFIHDKSWENSIKIIEKIDSQRDSRNHQNDQSAEDDQQELQHFSQVEYGILWKDAPERVLCALLKTFPDTYKGKGHDGKNLMQAKLHEDKWDSLKVIIEEVPHIVSVEDVTNVIRYKAPPPEIFRLILKQQPHVLLEEPDFLFGLIKDTIFVTFETAMSCCPAAAGLKDKNLQLTPLFWIFQEKSRINVDWIGTILKETPDAAKAKDYDGKTVLHLAYQHSADSQVIEMILKAYPEAINEKDNLGRTPTDMINESNQSAFVPYDKVFLLSSDVLAKPWDNVDPKAMYPNNVVVLSRGGMLVRDASGNLYGEQVLARHRIFGTLLDEFSRMVGIDNKDVIQKAATVQALACKCLSCQNDTIVDFRLFDNPGYWYQQEVLKLAMRVYHESKWVGSYDYQPAILDDAWLCSLDLEDRETGGPPRPSHKHIKAFQELTSWLANGIDGNRYSFQGPVGKPLQSLFNKLYIRRGQTTVHVIGDMVRATLLVDDVETLRQIISKIETTFRNIIGNQFKQPNSFNGLADFLTYVHEDLNFLPGSDDVLPYRFKANSSQKNRKEPLWYNLNFFLQVPEYHRVGFSEMFVACELQIGVEEEINKHRSVHVAYERDRILSNQPLLKNYDTAINKVLIKKEDDENSPSPTNTEINSTGEVEVCSFSNCTDDDIRLIDKVLYGRIGSEVLIPCTIMKNNIDSTNDSDKNSDENKSTLTFESGPFRVSKDQFYNSLFEKPKQHCVNNRSLNCHVSEMYEEDWHGRVKAAIIVAGPYHLDEVSVQPSSSSSSTTTASIPTATERRYYVESCVMHNPVGLTGTIGLYAHIGPYLVEIACAAGEGEEIILVQDFGHNVSFLEQVCPVPVKTKSLMIIAHGVLDFDSFQYSNVTLSLKVFRSSFVRSTV